MKKGTVGVLSTLVGFGTGVIGARRVMSKSVNDTQKRLENNRALFQMMNQWVKVKQEGKNLVEYFEKNNYKNIAIYGMSHVGETFISELSGSGVCVKYAVDRRAERIYADVEVLTIEDDLEEVDVMVVTAISYFDEIAESLEGKIDCPVISLEDIINEVY